MIIYREATTSDVPAICVLGQVVNLLHHEAWPRIFSPASDLRRDVSYWSRSIETENSTTFIAESSGEIVGFVTVGRRATEDLSLLLPCCFAHVGSVCVTEAFRGQGIGRELMAQAELWAAANGAAEVRLSVWSFNQPALRLYEELGYEVRSLSLAKDLR